MFKKVKISVDLNVYEELRFLILIFFRDWLSENGIDHICIVGLHFRYNKILLMLAGQFRRIYSCTKRACKHV